MDVDKLRDILKDHNLYKKDTSNGKNLICICPICSDHPDPRKKGHMYVSTDPSIPLAHCFYSGCVLSISELIKKLTGSKNLANEVITKEEEHSAKYESKKIRKQKTRSSTYILPTIDSSSFPNKTMYLRNRSRDRLTPEEIPNLILDFKAFLNMNHLNVVGDGKILSQKEMDLLCQYHVGFLSRHHTTVYSRSYSDELWLKFKKLALQDDGLHLLDYWCISGGDPDSNIIVLSEGNFDIMGEYVSDSLKIKDKVRLYASGNSFSYSSLLKSVCFDENLYKCDVVILSDIDKEPQWYIKFKSENSHIIQNLNIWANKSGKDFGEFPITPFLYKDTNFKLQNKTKNGLRGKSWH